uniref:Putative structural protein n=1 Tax=viral metagenome TaxID=1070528 RepID=A0A6H1ZCJ5_9ZZZZ
MREITDHRTDEGDTAIRLFATDEKPCHDYLVILNLGYPGPNEVNISFQNGPVAEVGVNGLTQEVLVATCIDRLRCPQEESPGRESALALVKLEEALYWLHRREKQ